VALASSPPSACAGPAPPWCLWDLDPAAGQVDVTDEASVARATDEVISKHGRIDILNLCQCGRNYQPANTQLSVRACRVSSDRRGTYRDVPVFAALWCRTCRRRVWPHRQFGLGRGQGGQSGTAPPIRLRKPAVMSLTKSLGKELAATEIRVNCNPPRPSSPPKTLFHDMREAMQRNLGFARADGATRRPEEAAPMYRVAGVRRECCLFGLVPRSTFGWPRYLLMAADIPARAPHCRSVSFRSRRTRVPSTASLPRHVSPWARRPRAIRRTAAQARY